jgi:pilus assembly protein CpaC
MALDLAVKFAGGDEKKVMSTINVTGKEQVMLRVRVTEIQRDVLKQFGIDTQALLSSGNFAANIANIIPLTANPTGLLAPSTGQAFTYQSGGTQIDGVIRMMERDGILRTLAEPTLTAISGESAKFLAGGQFPVPSSGNDNVEDGVVTRTVGVEFKDFGVGLGFTPVVMSEGRISLRINTEVSELTTENALTLGTSAAPILIPALKVRRAETTVELPSGGSMVLAGLIRDSTKQQINGIPGLKNLPVLGALFRSRDYLTNQTELAIIVTPFIVDAVNERQLASPLDGLNMATDRQTLLFGRLNKVYGASGEKPNGVYHGNVGFIVE